MVHPLVIVIPTPPFLVNMPICTCISGILIQGKNYGRKITSVNIAILFDTLKLKTVYSEPYALNAAPNKT
jgi:hypothetical protein